MTGQESINLNKSQAYYSMADNERYRVQSGSVQLFITPAFDATKTIDREVGRPIALAEISAEQGMVVIPGLYHEDPDRGVTWKLCLKATRDGTVIGIDVGVSKKLKENFLIQLDEAEHLSLKKTYDAEGGKGKAFEHTLVSFYSAEIARNAVNISQGVKANREAVANTIQGIAGSGNDANAAADLQAINAGTLYKTVYYAARKTGIPVIESEDRIMAACAKETLTVADIARESHFICREITLDMDWYKSDCGTVVAFLKVETGKDSKGRPKYDMHPLALCRRGNKYRCYDGTTGKESALTGQIADQLEPKAYSIRRPLPNGKLTMKDVLQFIRKGFQPGDIVHLAVLSLLCTLIGVLIPKLNQMIYDDYIPLGNINYLVEICLVILACMIGNVFVSIVRTLQEYRIPSRVGYELQDAVYHRLFELPERFFREYDSAELANRVSSVAAIANTLTGKVLTSGFTLAVSVVYWIQMGTYSGKLTLVCLLMLALYGTAIYFFSRHTLKYIKQIEEYKGEADGKLLQYISGVDKIRMAGAEDRMVMEYTAPVVSEKRLSLKTGRNSALLSVLMEAGGTLFSMVLYYMMIKSKTGISMGSFIAFTTAFGSVSSAVMGAVQCAVTYTQYKPIMERVSPVFREPPEDDRNKEIIAGLNGRVDVDNVVFGYQKDQPPVLNGLSIHIEPGEYVAIVGPSGCGKSTLLKLLLGFETPDEGRILYDGKDIAAVNKHSLRKRLGVVLQNGRLIAGSIFENITITSPEPDLKKAWSILEDVGLSKDVTDMPMGIHTVLNEDGSTISGGQQQRILIARAIYNEPSVLFFDEATSALDNMTQAKVCESLEKRRMTRLVIAHRLSTVRRCSRIIVLDKGRISEEGTYEQLMSLRGKFYEMAVRQIV